MTIESEQDLHGILRAGRVVASVRDQMLRALEPGMRTVELDQIGRRLLDEAGAQSAPQITYGFPGATCISVNEEAAHGVPGERVLAAGDIVNVDVSAELDGYFADTGATAAVPPGSALATRLCHSSRMALSQAMSQTSAGAPINRIGNAIQSVAKAHGFKVIRNLAGHGIGRSLHEAPEDIVGFHDRRDQRRLKLGQVIAVEPFLSTRSRFVEETDDGWTLVGHPASRSAQFEHTLIVTRGAPIVATRGETH